MDPTVIIPVDHSVAIDVKEGDYYSINVKHAKTADEVLNLPELKQTATDDDVVAFTIGEESYSKRVNSVQNATTALYDKKGRDLSTLASEDEYQSLVEQYLANKLLVQSVNGKTGNVTVNKNTVGLSNVDNTSDEDKPLSKATIEALEEKQDVLIAGSNIRIDGNVINALVDFSPILAEIEELKSNTNAALNEVQTTLNNLQTQIDDINNDFTALQNRLTLDENNVSENTNEIANLKTRLEAAESTLDEIDLSKYDLSEVVDGKIADAMAGEQSQDEDLLNRIKEVKALVDNEIVDRENADSAIKGEVTSALTSAVGTINVKFDDYYTKTEVDDKLANLDIPDVSPCLTIDDAASTYVTKLDFNDEVARIDSDIENNIGRVLTADPGESNRLWVEDE